MMTITSFLPWAISRWSGRFLAAGAFGALGLLLLTGCKGTPTRSEREARAQQQSFASAFRPHGQRPTLPVLAPEAALSNFVAYAMLNQPAVESAYYDWLAAIERITVARSRPDPQLVFQMDIQDIVTSVMPGLMLNFPGPGKLRAGADLASAESQVKYAVLQATILQSAFDVKRAYYQLYFLEEKIRVNEETLDLLGSLEQLARAQNEVGKVTLQDVLRAQIEQERITSETANLQDSRTALLAQFKAALGIRPGEPAPPIPQRFESTPLDLTSEQVLAAALIHSTKLQAVDKELAAADAAIGLAQKARIPDSSVGLMADVKMAPVLYRPLATVSLPIWRDKIAAQIAEAQASKQSATARFSTEQIALAVSVAEKMFVYREATRNLALLQEQLLPQQRQSLEVARSGYLSGQIDFFNLTDAEQTLLRFRRDEVEARIQRELALTELSLIIEGMVPSDSSSGVAVRSMGDPSSSGMKKSNPGSAMK